MHSEERNVKSIFSHAMVGNMNKEIIGCSSLGEASQRESNFLKQDRYFPWAKVSEHVA